VQAEGTTRGSTSSRPWRNDERLDGSGYDERCVAELQVLTAATASHVAPTNDFEHAPPSAIRLARAHC
jgi:hypothetical protein